MDLADPTSLTRAPSTGDLPTDSPAEDASSTSPAASFSSGPTVSVVVPVHNGGRKFFACIDALLGLHPPADEILIVADGEGDGSWRYASDNGLPVLTLEESGGPALARNAAAKHVKGDIIYFVDADCIAHADVIGKIKRAFTADPDLGALIGSYDDSPSEPDLLSQYRNLLHHYTHQISSEEGFTFWGACGAIRREVFSQVGGFDRKYRLPSIEDIELGYRIKAAGYRIKLVKDIYVKHLKHWGPWNIVRTDFLQRALPWSELILRNKRANTDLNLSVANRICVATVGLMCMALVAGLFYWKLWSILVLGAVVLTVLNWHQYRFFFRKRGLLFTLGTVPWNWLFYFYSGLGFAIAMLKVRLGVGSKRKSVTSSALLADERDMKLVMPGVPAPGLSTMQGAMRAEAVQGESS